MRTLAAHRTTDKLQDRLILFRKLPDIKTPLNTVSTYLFLLFLTAILQAKITINMKLYLNLQNMLLLACRHLRKLSEVVIVATVAVLSFTASVLRQGSTVSRAVVTVIPAKTQINTRVRGTKPSLKHSKGPQTHLELKLEASKFSKYPKILLKCEK